MPCVTQPAGLPFAWACASNQFNSRPDKNCLGVSHKHRKKVKMQNFLEAPALFFLRFSMSFSDMIYFRQAANKHHNHPVNFNDVK